MILRLAVSLTALIAPGAALWRAFNRRGRTQPDEGSLRPEDQPEGDVKWLPPQFERQLVNYQTSEPEGTITIDTSNTYLYQVLGHGKALRYGVGVGREGFTWAGTQRIARMVEWPDWHPPTEMIDRQPYLPPLYGRRPG